jgi:hypothetical protein
MVSYLMKYLAAIEQIQIPAADHGGRWPRFAARLCAIRLLD